MTEFLPEIEYSGPAELAPLWDQFTRAYTANRPYSISSANLLNQLAFGGAESILCEHGKTLDDFTDVKERVENCAMLLSSLEQEDTSLNPLLEAIVNTIAKQWVALKKAYGLYPAPPMGNGRGPKVDAIREKHDTLLTTPAGTLVSGALRMLTDSTIDAHIYKAEKHFNDVDSDIILRAAETCFHSSLFNFEISDDPQIPKASFGGFVENGLSLSLNTYIYRLIPEYTRSLDDPRTQGGALRDTKDPGPDASASDSEEQIRLREKLSALDARDQKVLRMRYGIDCDPCTQAETAKAIGVKKTRIEQLESRAKVRLKIEYLRKPPHANYDWEGLISMPDDSTPDIHKKNAIHRER